VKILAEKFGLSGDSHTMDLGEKVVGMQVIDETVIVFTLTQVWAVELWPRVGCTRIVPSAEEER